MELDYSISFAEQYKLNPQEYADVHVRSLPLSVRVTNRFKDNQINTLADLLQKKPTDLMQISGFGRGCLDELDKLLVSMQEDSVSLPDRKIRLSGKISQLYRENILSGDFSFADEELLTEKEIEGIRVLQEAYENLGPELVFECTENPSRIQDLMFMFRKFCFSAKRSSEVRMLMDSVPAYRRHNLVRGYINAYTQDEGKREMLVSQYSSPDATLGQLIGVNLDNEEVFIQVKKFLKWCTFDLAEDVETLISSVYEQGRLRTIVEMRARKKTLEQTGNKLKVTRERIRQLELKALRIFSKYQGRIKLIAKISAEKNGDTVITPADIERYSGEYSVELQYLLRNYTSGTYTYDSQLDVFIIGDDSLRDRVYAFVETLPDLIPSKNRPGLLELARKETDLSGEMVEKAIRESYRLAGDVLHRSRLSLAAIYTTVLQEHYPNGIMAYDAEEIRKFRAFVTSEYGEVNMPANDRALTARIAGICILCGRGMYKLKQKNYIPKDLAKRIYNYIVDSDNSIFLTNTLFSVFEEDLRKAGVDNKYYLQGILHELYGDKFVFRRDYVSKDGGETSIYSSVVEFIKRSQYPVSKSQIQAAYPGISDIVINFSIGDQSVLNYFGEYLHTSRLTILPEEERYLDNVLWKVLADGASHHVKDTYEVIDREKPEILTRNAAIYPFSAFSILEYLLRDNYQFSRPYVALQGVEIGRPAERLHELLYSSDQFTFEDISEFSKENHYMIQSQLEYVNSCNDAYLIINNTTAMAIEKIGVNESIAKAVENAIISEIQETTPIRQLLCWGQFPSMDVVWTDWLVYSVLNKWSTKLDVATSSNQFRLSIPLVAPKGMMDTSAFVDAYKDPAQMAASKVTAADNLDNIDDLLADLLADELLEDKIWV